MYSHPMGELGAIATVSKTSPNYILGKQIISSFHYESKRYPIYKFKTVDELIASIKSGDAVVQGIGAVAKATEKPITYAQAQMVKLAQIGKGRVPERSAYTDIISKGAVDTTWTIITESLKESAIAAGSKAVQLAQGVVDTAEGTLKSTSHVLKFLPYYLVGLGAIFVYFSSKNLGSIASQYLAARKKK